LTVRIWNDRIYNININIYFKRKRSVILSEAKNLKTFRIDQGDKQNNKEVNGEAIEMKFKRRIIFTAILLGLFIISYIVFMRFQADIILNMGVSVFYMLRNILYAVMSAMVIIILIIVVLYLLYFNRRKTMNRHFNLIDDGTKKVESIDDIIGLINEIRQVTTNKEIKTKLDEIEEQTRLFSLKKKTFSELFDMKDIEFKSEIKSDLTLTEKNLIGNWFNMLFIIKSLEGIYSQQTTSSHSIEKANREFVKNTAVNEEMFESLNALFVKTAGSNNKVSSSKISVESTIEAMASNDALNNINAVNDDIKFK